MFCKILSRIIGKQMYLLKNIDTILQTVIKLRYSIDGERNMKKVLAVGLVAILLVVVGIGCVPSAAQPAATAPAVNINTINAEVTAIKTWQTDIVSWRTTTVDPMIGKINRGEIGGGTNYQSQIDSAKATLAEQNTKIADLTSRLTAAENKITTMGTVQSQTGGIAQTGGTGQTTQFTPGTLTGTIPTSPTGGIVSQVNWVQGTSQLYSSPSGSSNNIWYVQRLQNQSTTIQYVRPMITLGVSSSYGYSTSSYFAGMNINISSPQGSIAAVYNPVAWGWSPAIACNTTGSWPMSGCASNVVYSTISGSQSAAYPYAPVSPTTITLAPGLGQVTNSMLIMPTSGLSNGLGEFYISPGGYVDITVMIQGIYTNTATMWNIGASYSSHT
jgi:hypothetical protein